jgi:hypothetical protein
VANWVGCAWCGGHGGWSSAAIHAHELGHLMGLAHSGVAGETSVYANEYDTMSGLDESLQEPKNAIAIYKVVGAGTFKDPDSGETADATRVAVLGWDGEFDGDQGVQVVVDHYDLSKITVTRWPRATDVTAMSLQDQHSGLDGAFVTHLLNLSGVNFVPGDVATLGKWTLEGTKIVSGFVTTKLMQVTVPNAAMSSPGGYVSVITPTYPYTPSNPMLLYLGPPGVEVTAKQQTSGWMPTPQVTLGNTNGGPTGGGASLTGGAIGKIALVSYTSDPLGAHGPGPEAAMFYGAMTTDDLPSVTVKMCGRDRVNYAMWSAGDVWLPVQQPIKNVNNCLSFTADGSTTPSAKDLRSAFLMVANDRSDAASPRAPACCRPRRPLRSVAFADVSSSVTVVFTVRGAHFGHPTSLAVEPTGSTLPALASCAGQG